MNINKFLMYDIIDNKKTTQFLPQNFRHHTLLSAQSSPGGTRYLMSRVTAPGLPEGQ